MGKETYKILDRWEYTTTTNEQLDEEGNVLVPSQDCKTVVTKVEYYLDKGTIIIEVPHFMPKDDNDIIRGLDNRFNSENIK